MPAESGIPFRRIAISRLNPSSLPPGESLPNRLVTWMEHALARGADALMIRETLDTATWSSLLTALADRYPQRDFTLLLNGFYGPDGRVGGYHFREHAFWAGDRLPGFLLGKSCHSLTAAKQAQAEGYHYLIFSPVFATDTHPGEIPAGLTALSHVCQGVALPVFALGGVTDANEAECLAAGAWGTAAIGRFQLPD